VAAFRAIGLFADRVGLSDADLATEIEEGLIKDWGDPGSSDEPSLPIPPDDPLLDLLVAERDGSRVWWSDLEADVADGNDVYVETITALGDISVGALEPADVSETWASETGPVTIEFTADGAPHELQPAYIEDWIDPGILVGLNELIEGSGRRFELVKAFDQTAFVMALTSAEREAFEARGWCFE
jgi:hypothetical protein